MSSFSMMPASRNRLLRLRIAIQWTVVLLDITLNHGCLQAPAHQNTSFLGAKHAEPLQPSIPRIPSPDSATLSPIMALMKLPDKEHRALVGTALVAASDKLELTVSHVGILNLHPKNPGHKLRLLYTVGPMEPAEDRKVFEKVKPWGLVVESIDHDLKT